MGLTRTSSGLLWFDDFSSDTSAQYSILNWSPSFADGRIHKTTSNAGSMVKTGITTAKCVTTRLKFSDLSACGAGVLLSDGVYTTFHRGYDCFAQPNASRWYLYYWNQSGSYSNKGGVGYPFTFEAETNYLCRIYALPDHYFRIRAGATDLSVGTAQYQDAITLGSELTGGMSGYSTKNDHDWLDIRTSHTITCTGMTTGHYLRVSDGTTAAEAQESSGTATVDAGAVLFPLATVQIRTAAAGGGDLIAELDTGDYADMGGGDAFAYSGASAVWLPFMKHNVIGLGGLYG
jgi:hypothetical protein